MTIPHTRFAAVFWTASRENFSNGSGFIQPEGSIQFPGFSGTTTQQADDESDPLDLLIAESESDPATAKALCEGRKILAERFLDGEDTLTSLRLKRGLSQAQLGERVGLKQSAIARYEAGGTQPRAANATKMAEQLGVTLEQFFAAQARSASNYED